MTANEAAAKGTPFSASTATRLGTLRSDNCAWAPRHAAAKSPNEIVPSLSMRAVLDDLLRAARARPAGIVSGSACRWRLGGVLTFTGALALRAAVRQS